MPTTSGGIQPQTVRSSSSSSSSHQASTSELNDAPGPSTSCPGSTPESMHTQRPSGSARTGPEGKTGHSMLTLLQQAVSFQLLSGDILCLKKSILFSGQFLMSLYCVVLCDIVCPVKAFLKRKIILIYLSLIR